MNISSITTHLIKKHLFNLSMKIFGISSRSSFLTFVFILLSINTLSAQTKIDTVGLNRLNGGLKALSLDGGLVHANWGFCLMDPKTGKIVTDFDSERSLMPASSMKVVTTITALNLLGANYTYKTYIQYDGTISADSILNGNLYITGSGDPSLGSDRIDSAMRFDSLVIVWASKIKKAGIKKITGNIIADASAFEDYAVPGSWNWDDIGQYYGAGPYGLNVYENKYTLYYSSTKTTAKIDSIFPQIDGLNVMNDVTVGGSSDAAFIYGAPDNYSRYVVGTIPASRKQYTVDGSMPDPPLFLATELRNALDSIGVEVLKQPTTVYAMQRAMMTINANRKNLFEYTSPPLSELIFHTNQKSINLYAEALLKTIGKEQLKDGSSKAGARAVEAYLLGQGFNLSGFNQDDGSGLSRLDFITPKQMCNLLLIESKQANFPVFKESLPIAGRTGTLKTIADNTVAEGKIFAKSGSMYKVRSYSGYVTTKSGELLSFCVIVNNYTCSSAEIREKLEKLMVWMVGL